MLTWEALKKVNFLPTQKGVLGISLFIIKKKNDLKLKV